MRHGSTGRAGILDGRTDPALTSEGWAVFKEQTNGKSWSCIITSPRRRAYVAAHELAAKAEIPLITDKNWAEYDFGQWDGRARAEIEATRDGKKALADFYADPVAHCPPDGEPWLDFSARISSALLRSVELNNGASPVLVVTHAGPIRHALALATGMPDADTWAFRIAYGTRLRLEVGRGPGGEVWAEIVELEQPSSAGAASA
jgi:alpha-ribazole phosphatase